MVNEIQGCGGREDGEEGIEVVGGDGQRGREGGKIGRGGGEDGQSGEGGGKMGMGEGRWAEGEGVGEGGD